MTGSNFAKFSSYVYFVNGFPMQFVLVNKNNGQQ